jgi:hypothetical protein
MARISSRLAYRGKRGLPVSRNDDGVMNTQIATAAPKRIRKSKKLLAISAVTFLTLSVWMGPEAACWLIGSAAIVAVWTALCRRFPTVGWFTYVFFNSFVLGLIGGLFGYRGGGYRYTYRPAIGDDDEPTRRSQ